ncbi:MAG: Zn-dependent hydrolase [Chryseobacterium sp.]|nr:MAG: Zn-dependent hydrolase [Chryseobacterium sp.]
MTVKFLKAHKGDCFVISYADSLGKNRNIIIDSGMDGTYYNPSTNIYGELKTEIDNIKKRKEVVDLLILSHIDNDHICGFLKYFQMDSSAPSLVKEVWFNSGKLIAKKLNEQENKDLNIKLQTSDTVATGVTEGIAFEDFLIKHNIWKQDLILEHQELEIHDAKFQILSPSVSQLKKLLKEYHEKTSDDVYTSAGSKDWNIGIKAFIDQERNSFRFTQDGSVKNGSSISFILTINKHKFIFLADSHPKGVNASLKRLGFDGKNPISVSFLKVSHHGSKANTNKEQIATISTKDYLISTDSSGHGHPNKRTLARIIAQNPDAIFHFNYEHVRNGVFSESDRKDFTVRARITTEFNY